MIKPVLQDDAFLEDVRGRGTEIHLWWLGQSGFVLKHGSDCLVFDPYLSDSLTKKYADTDKPHIRMTERVVDPGRLGQLVDVVTSSHNHTDHLDADTLRPMLAANPNVKLVIPEANRGFVTERLGCYSDLPAGLSAGESTLLAGFRIHAVPAAHEEVSPGYLGYVVEIAGVKIYHAGDTVLYDGMVETLLPFDIDIALLPINGSAPERRVAGNLWGREAAALAHSIGAGLAVPMHYEMFTFNTESPAEFIRECMRLNQPYRVLHAGERIDWPENL